ncbi:DUF86 domain-containing protein [Oculatella sp. LEGE 06141]|uniref:HepT-like ribonuclease domain-containing protein n=1 Tax=Oculatella sp. LEGE 06141 TaxID=1828648 RepID=UPI001881146A|nr:HepT-like ribonuclease domain-containing protein [Oculatella sp. LEGE 06141]MBE9177524.1 DUF86 domain-containing protein [Oculatella sp. LEGE 06141]
MTSNDWQQRINPILSAIAAVQMRTSGIPFETFQSNETVAKATLYDFLVISAAAQSVPAEFRSRHTQVPWQLMQDLRRVVAYDHTTNLEFVWRTIQNDFPVIAAQVQGLLQVQ